MCLDPIGLVWMKDLVARKPRPTSMAPGLICMLNGATQHNYTDPFDTTSPAVPIGSHWMIIWPFDTTAAVTCSPKWRPVDIRLFKHICSGNLSANSRQVSRHECADNSDANLRTVACFLGFRLTLVPRNKASPYQA
jgi:hypothetical protein